MLSKIYSSGVIGIEGFEVIVECSAWNRIPRFDLVGLPDTAVKESKNRVQSACENSGAWLTRCTPSELHISVYPPIPVFS